MPFTKVGPNEYVSPSGRKFTTAQVRLYYATNGFQAKPRKRMTTKEAVEVYRQWRKRKFEGSGQSGNYGHAGRPGLVGGSTTHGGGMNDADFRKYTKLKQKWATINHMTLPYVDKPDSPEAKEGLRQMRGVSKQISRMNIDPGGMEGIGLPGGPKDLVVVGAGPGGLSSAMMAASDGLDTMFIDSQTKIGGQAKFSSRIENYPGFPVGITGSQLAQNMYQQTTRLGAEAKLGVKVTGMTYDPKTGLKTITLSDGQKVEARAVVIAGGLEFKKLQFPGSNSKAVVYGNGEMLAKLGKNKPVAVIGGSNGAAQAALHLSTKASHVYLISRSPIENSMSDYQSVAVRTNKKITVIENDEIQKLFTNQYGGAEALLTKSGKRLPAAAVGIFVGGAPKTDWLPKQVKMKEGKIMANHDLETGVPGVFAVGDIRHGSIPRIGAAVGDGQIAERNVFQYFDRIKKRKK